jgi:ABC-type glycerol-3-phosphate transport system substrate-binding protein
MLPMPPKLTVSRRVLTGTIKKDYKVVTETKIGPTIRDLKNNFVGAVADDVYLDSQTWALPMSFDTLALYYNRNLLNQAKIVEPPLTWDEFITDVKALTLIDPQGKIVQAGAAMGTASNVNYAADILSVLMLQNGTTMASAFGATFNQASADDKDYFPGEAALRFYTDFAAPSKEVYTWNKDMPDSFSAFVQGKTAFYFGYAGDILKIKNSAPSLNFDVTKIPQITGSLKQTDIANYYVETVAKKTKYPGEAWTFVLFASDPANVKSFLDRAKRPTALRALIKDQLNNFDLAPFVNQVLISQSWYHGRNWVTAEQAMKNMIDDVANGVRTLKESISYYIQIINQTY